MEGERAGACGAARTLTAGEDEALANPPDCSVPRRGAFIDGISNTGLSGTVDIPKEACWAV